MPHSDDLVAWFGALAGDGRGYCIAVVKRSTPGEVLERSGVAPGSVFEGTWHELLQHRDATDAGGGRVVAAIAIGFSPIWGLLHRARRSSAEGVRPPRWHPWSRSAPWPTRSPYDTYRTRCLPSPARHIFVLLPWSAGESDRYCRYPRGLG